MVIRVNYLRRNQFYDIVVPEEDKGDYKRGDFVILEIAKEEEVRKEVGKVVLIHDFDDLEANPPKLIRRATDKDVKKIHEIQELEKKAFTDFLKRIKKHELDMRPVAVFISFDEKFVDFVYEADERVDFREMVKELAGHYKKKIFLEQIGSRDRAQIMDGCGSCGRKLCCSTFLKDRPPVTMTAIKGQDLYSRDRDKLTGLCGKLKCCLNYELAHYEQLAKAFPKHKAKIEVIATKEPGIIIGRSILDQMVRIAYEEEGKRPEVLPLSAIKLRK